MFRQREMHKCAHNDVSKRSLDGHLDVSPRLCVGLK